MTARCRVQARSPRAGDHGDEDGPALAAEPGGEFGGEGDVEPAGGGAGAGAQAGVDGLGAVGPGGDLGQVAEDGLGGAHVAEGGARALVDAEDDADDLVGGVVDDTAAAEAGGGEFAGVAGRSCTWLSRPRAATSVAPCQRPPSSPAGKPYMLTGPCGAASR
ncbi:hypothetical protein GCM10017687_31350 [Streptomyces echinatus]